MRSQFGGKSEWKQSLGVRDYETAKPLFAAEDAKRQARKKVVLASIGPGAAPMNKADAGVQEAQAPTTALLDTLRSQTPATFDRWR